MKKKNLWTGILAIVFTMIIVAVGCDNGTTDDKGQQNGKGLPPVKGKLTINGFTPDFENRYVYAQGFIGDSKPFYGITDCTISYSESKTTFKLVKITNGSAVVPLYTLKDVPATSVSSFIAYNGNDPVSLLQIMVVDVAELNSNNIATELVSAIFSGNYMMVSTGTFSNGSLTTTWLK